MTEVIMPPAVQSLGRFQVLPHNQLIAPAKCAGCGSYNQKAHYVDLNLEVEFYGVVYLCLDVCFREVANLLGFISPAQAKELADRLERKEEVMQRMQADLNNLEVIRDAIDGYRGSSVVPDSAADSGDSRDIHESGDPEGVSTEGQPDSAVVVGESGSPESVEVIRLGDVPDDDPSDEIAEFERSFDL